MLFKRVTRPVLMLATLGALAACASEPHQYAQPPQSSKAVPSEYQAREDDGKEIAAVNPRYLVERNRRQMVPYHGPEAVGTIVVDPFARFLYYITAPGEAERYGVAVGREGKGFAGVMKRHGFHGFPASHGTERKHRAPGSIASFASDAGLGGNLKKGKKMPGHMGNRRVTTKNHSLVTIDEERNLLVVKGAVPGPAGGYVIANAVGVMVHNMEGVKTD